MTVVKNEGPSILLIEDEAPIRKFLRISLEAQGYRITETRFGEEGLTLCAQEPPELVILDLGLPDIEGLTFIERLREWSNVPVIVLSVRSDEHQKVFALDAGANDYVTKPFGISELLARIRGLLRTRSQPVEHAAYFENGGLEVDLLGRRVWVDGRECHLARKEYALLTLLARQAGRVLTHHQIIESIWGPDRAVETQNLRVLVGNLRQKLGDDPGNPRFIMTEPGVGYRLQLAAVAARTTHSP